MTRHLSRLTAIALVGLCLGCPSQPDGDTTDPAASTGPEAAPAVDAAALRENAGKLFAALPSEAPASSGPASEALVSLGRQLYFEARLDNPLLAGLLWKHGITQPHHLESEYQAAHGNQGK